MLVALAGVPCSIWSQPQPGVAAYRPGPEQTLIVEIVLNGRRQGEFTVLSAPRDDYLVAEEDLQAMGVQRLRGTPVPVDGRRFFSLRELGAGELRLDEATLSLHVALPPELLPAQTIDFRPARPARMIEPQDSSAFFNYRAFQSGDGNGGGRSLTLSTEAGVRVGELLLRSESFHTRSAGVRQDIRYATQLTHDDRVRLRRWTLGDFVAGSGELGTGLNLGGLSLAKSYQIDPYFVRQPMAGLSAAVAAPAEAEIYVDGVRVRTETLQPGLFELRNLNDYGGLREVSVVIRDAFGNVQQLAAPHYFTPTHLRQGLHDYSYNLGLQRRQFSSGGDQYGDWAATAYHRYGLDDAVTLGGQAEAEPGRFNLGPALSWRSDRLGVSSVGAVAGRNPLGRGWAAVVRHAYQSRAFSSQVELRRHSAGYQAVGRTETGAAWPKSELGLGAGVPLASLGHLNLSYRKRQPYEGPSRHSLSIGYSRSLFGTVSLLGSVSRVWGEQSSTQALLALSYSPQRDLSTHLSVQRQDEGTNELLQLASSTPQAGGLGYRLTAERLSSQQGRSVRVNPSLQYYGPAGIYSLDLHSERDTDGRQRQAYQLGVGGGVAYVGGAWALARPLTDGFALVQVGDLPGVRVYRNSEEVARTDARGRAFVPHLGSYIANRISIDDRDIPIEYAIAQKELNVAPALRGGARVRFEVERQQTVTGRLLLPRAGGTQPARYADVQVTANGKTLRFPTGADGEFYVEGLPAGRHPARLGAGGSRCEFELRVPSSSEMLIDLGELHACPPLE